MFYAIYATDAENSLNNRLNSRPAHVARLNELIDLGKIAGSLA